MKATNALSFLLVTSLASAHYTFNRLFINGAQTEVWEYVRKNTRDLQYNPTKFINSFGVTPLDNDFRCNMGSFSNAGKTKVADVVPGDKLAVQLGVGATMRHPGPAQVYLSKAPGSVIQYQGDGDWFKIHEDRVCGNLGDGLQDVDWCTWDKDRVSFTIPVGTPPGEYLARVEHVGLHGAHAGEAEFYYSCVQLKIGGDGTGSPSPLVKFPGAYQPTDPGIAFSIWSKPKDYPYHIGPAVWAGGSTGASGNTTDDDVNTSSIPTLHTTTFITSTKKPTISAVSTSATAASSAAAVSAPPAINPWEAVSNPAIKPTSTAVSTKVEVSAVPQATSTAVDAAAPVISKAPEEGPAPTYGGPRGPKKFSCIELDD